MLYVLILCIGTSCCPFGIRETDTVKEAEEKIIHSLQKEPEDEVKLNYRKIG